MDSASGYAFCLSIFFSASRYFLPSFHARTPVSACDVDAHAPGGPRDDLLRALDFIGVQVGHLGFRDLLELGRAQRAHLVLVRLAGTLLDILKPF